ncbi:Methyltransferase domain-containing protein [Variovorax sp. OK605]|jgi:SAM-dependent methyltransferase|uniref:class I SAM-dependent methyltransferase n=1 Tax=Variovorax sp. OK605 TaxID=1855317 RepID=UPI0008E77119|nr:class I SAM-dependent methyltransferase [Variovorax sp. OK605]SFO97824.1 Methyltransferase domain-containing protein [Variovorax sp. OK605]
MSNKVDFDDYTDNYNELLRESTGFFSASEEYFARYKIQLVQKLVKRSPKRILEYGCGIGRNIPFLHAAFPDAHIEGSDISAASLDIARRDNPGIEFFLEEDQVEAGEPVDLIFVAGVFHHIPPSQRTEVARKLFQRLAPGGELYVFEHNPYNPVTRRIVDNCPYDEDAVLLKPSELKSLFKGASLKVEGAAYCLFIPPKLSALAWMENGLGWLPLGGQYWVRGLRPA